MNLQTNGTYFPEYPNLALQNTQHKLAKTKRANESWSSEKVGQPLELQSIKRQRNVLLLRAAHCTTVLIKWIRLWSHEFRFGAFPRLLLCV